MQQYWQFAHPDTWTPLAACPFVLADGQDGYDAMQEAGYGHADTLGDEDGVGTIEVWTSRDLEVPYPFLALVTVPGFWKVVVALATAPDVLAYYARYGSITHTVQLNAWSAWIRDVPIVQQLHA